MTFPVLKVFNNRLNIDYVEMADSVYGGMSDDPGHLCAA